MRKMWGVLLIFGALGLSGCADTMVGRGMDAGPPVVADNTMEKQAVELRSCFGSYGDIRVESCGRAGVVLEFHSDTLFESNSARLSSSVLPGLGNVAEILKKHPDTKIIVDVHTDCLRSEEENLTVSSAQADAIKEILQNRGVQQLRITARGWGESKPVASNATEEGRHANRRATITICN